jgi:hypothetical protein
MVILLHYYLINYFSEEFSLSRKDSPDAYVKMNRELYKD